MNQIVSPRRIAAIVRKEFKQVSRDRRTLGILLIIPAFMLIMFGYALNFDVKHTSLAIYDEDCSRMSREFVQNFLHSEYFDLKYVINDPDRIEELIGKELCRAVIVIPRDFSENLLAGREAPVQVIVDGANSNAAATAIGYVASITQGYSAQVLLEALARVGRRDLAMPIDLRPRVWFNPELRSARFLVPGLIAFILMVTAVISTSLSVVREKERNTLEQIVVSPTRPSELIIGKTIPYIIISLAATMIILAVGYIFFDVSVRGSYLLLFLVTFVFLTGCLGMGLLISTVAETQQVAFIMAIILTMLPTFILSGFVFPIRNMPVVIQAITYFIPARYFLVVLRGIILKGTGLGSYPMEVLFLLLFTTAMITASAVRMRVRKG